MAADLILENDRINVTDGDLDVGENLRVAGTLNVERAFVCRDDETGRTWLKADATRGRASMLVGAWGNPRDFDHAEIRVRASDGDNRLSSKGLRANAVNARELAATRANAGRLEVRADTYGEVRDLSHGIAWFDDKGAATLTIDAKSGSLRFGNGTEPLAYVFASGSANPDRPVIAHSPAHPTWGLAYRDQGDKFLFQSAGRPVQTVDLGKQRVGIGTPDPQHALHVVGTVAATAPFHNLSDARCKTEVEPVVDALATVRRLQGVTFAWSDEAPGRTEGRQLGFLAQDVESVVPEVVRHDDQGMRSLAYGSLIPLLTEAIKDLQRQVEQLQDRLAALEQQCAACRD
ncbi:MAG: tail fiber domain-containing protein [Myxococcota bacterium]